MKLLSKPIAASGSPTMRVFTQITWIPDRNFLPDSPTYPAVGKLASYMVTAGGNRICRLGLESLDQRLAALHPGRAIERFRGRPLRARFHLKEPEEKQPILLAICRADRNGKSTLVNRLLGADLTATSFRRTFTAGVVDHRPNSTRFRFPQIGLGIDPIFPTAQELPARGHANALAIVPFDSDLTSHITLIDTPDLDGDQPMHHAQADRAFRWAQAILFHRHTGKVSDDRADSVLPNRRAVWPADDFL